MKHKILLNKFFQLFLILFLVFFTSSLFFYKKTSLHPDDHEYLFFTKVFSETNSLFFYNDSATVQQNPLINKVGKSVIKNEVYFNLPMRFYGTPIVLGFISKFFSYDLVERFAMPTVSVFVLLIFYFQSKGGLKKTILLLTSPFFLFMTANVDSTFLGILFYLASLFFIKKKDVFSYLISGFLLGLSFMVRPNILFLFTVNFYFLIKNFLEEKTFKPLLLFIFSFSIVLVYMMHMNSILYGNFYTLGYWYSESSDLNNISRAVKNIGGGFNFLVDNVSLIPKLFYYGLPFLFLLPFFIKRNRQNFIYFLLLLPYFLYITSKPFGGYGLAFDFESTISSPIRYLSPFFITIIYLLEFKKDVEKQKLFIVGIILNIYVVLFQPIMSYPAVYFEKNVLGYNLKQLVENELSKDDVLVTDYFLKWSNFDRYNIMSLKNDLNIEDIIELSKSGDVYLLPLNAKEKEFYLNNQSSFSLIREKEVSHYRGQDDLMVNKTFKLYRFNK